MSKNKVKKEQLIHITKNDSMPIYKSLSVRVFAVLAALLVIGILSVLLIKENPFKIYGALFTGAFIDNWSMLQNTALLLMFGLAIVPAFRMKYWNMGANGQVLAGCLASIACMRFIPVKFPDISNTLLIIIMILASLIVSVIWTVVPAIFKAFFSTNETLFTLMMNYIAAAVVNYYVFSWDKSGSGNIGIVNLMLGKKGWFADIGNKYLLSIIIALVMAVFMYIYMRYTKHGFEVQMVGESVNTAKYIGLNVKKVIVRTLFLNGIICGIIGALYAGSISHTINQDVGGLGFTAILIAWLANFDPLIMIFTSYFVEFIDSGAKNVSVVFQLKSNDYANIVIGIIFFFIIGCEFFIRYKIHFNKKSKTAEKEGA